MVKITVVAPPNIAIVKYWGKNPLWERYHIPTKSSLSFTVDKLYTQTTLVMEEGKGEIEFTLNGEKIDATKKEFEYVGKYVSKLHELIPETKKYNFYVESSNNFPTAAGFASSASGFAAMAKAIQGAMKELEPRIYSTYFSNDHDLSVFARLGSGSATRSIPSEGGLVLWRRGIPIDYPFGPEEVSNQTKNKIIFSSYAETLLKPEYWNELRIIYVKVKQSEKKVKSRAGMKMTLKTNPVYKNWINYEETILLKDTIESIKNRNFETFAKNTMKLSNGLHAMMLYTEPRIVYLNDTSHKIIDGVLDLNEEEIKAAYTFDAGPNTVIFTLSKYENEVKSLLKDIVGEENILITKQGKGARFV